MRKWIFLFLLIASPVFGADYYVNCTTGNDTTGDGSGGTPWKSLTKAFKTVNGDGQTNTIHVAGAPCLAEGVSSGVCGAGAGSVNTYVCDDAALCEMRISEAAITYSTYAYYMTRTGRDVFGKGANGYGFKWRQDVLGDDSADTTKYFFYWNGDSTLEFEDSEMVGGANLYFVGGGGPTGGTLKMSRNYFHEHFLAPFYNRGNVYLYANYFDLTDNHAFYITTNGTVPIARIVNNTFIQTSVTDNGTTTITDLVYDNNLHVSDGTAYSVQLDGTVTTITSAKNNAMYNLTPPSPRTNAGYPKISITGWADNTYYIPPSFDTAPALLATSLLLCRGSSTYAPSKGYNQVAYDAACPTIGAWYPTGGTKQNLTPDANEIVFVGDSHTYGTGCTLGTGCYFDVIEDDGDFAGYTVVDMPGAAGYMWAISGMTSIFTLYAMQDAAVTTEAEKLVLNIGGNDVATTESSMIAQRIMNTLTNVRDLGWDADDVIYVGTLPTNLATPVFAPSLQAEFLVTAQKNNIGFRSVQSTCNALKRAGWNTAFNQGDNVHWNDTGHAFIASKLKPHLLGQTVYTCAMGSMDFPKFIRSRHKGGVK